MKKLASTNRRRRSILAFEMVRLDRSANEPLHQQLYRQIRDELRLGNVDHRFSRLPSSRALALDLGVSRLTVTEAFSKLLAEGYLVAKPGSGTFVAEPLPEAFLSVRQAQRSVRSEAAARFARRVNHIPDPRVGRAFDLGATAATAGALFVPGVPAVDEFPIDAWERLRAEVLARKGANLLRYGSNRGDAELRKALATYLCDFRGARCHADQIVITAGTQQAMLICAMALVNPSERVWIEDPGYHQARRVFAFAGSAIVPRPLDSEGIVLTSVTLANAPRLVFVTPSHQFPTGITMSERRRAELIRFAAASNAYVFEDDYDSEFRFIGPPLQCLQGLDTSGRVIYAGTMSKILFPSLRLGFLVVPEPLVDGIAKIRSVVDQHSSAIDQATLARFVTEGFFLSHLKRMRKLYAERRQFFIEEFEKHVGNRFRLQPSDAGLHLLAQARRRDDFDKLYAMRTALSIRPPALSAFCIEAKPPPAFLFGFAGWSRAQLRDALLRLRAALNGGARTRSRGFS